MPGIIRRIVGQSAQSERIFVQILRVADESLNKITAPDIVRQIAEEPVAEGVIPEVLNDASAVQRLLGALS